YPGPLRLPRTRDELDQRREHPEMAARSSPGTARVPAPNRFEDCRVETGRARISQAFGQALPDRRDRKAYLLEKHREHWVSGRPDEPGVEGLMVVSGTDRVSTLACFLEEGHVPRQLGNVFLGAVLRRQLGAPLLHESPDLVDDGQRLEERRLADRQRHFEPRPVSHDHPPTRLLLHEPETIEDPKRLPDRAPADPTS